MKTNYTPTPLASFLAIALEKKMIILDETKGWYEIRATPKGPKVYLPKGDELITRCDLSGFEMPAADEDGPAGEHSDTWKVKTPYALVTERLQFTGRTQDEVLASFARVLDYMATLPDLERKQPKRLANASRKSGPPTKHDGLALEVARLMANGMHILQAIRTAQESFANAEQNDSAYPGQPKE